MIIPELNALFVHVPKTAGQSVEACFLDHLAAGPEDHAGYLLNKNADPAKGPPRLAHLIAPEYVTLGHMSQQAFDRAFKFGFVRNPWNRLVSEYRFSDGRVRVSFRTWIMRDFPTPGWSDPWRHVMPQVDYLFDKNGEPAVDYIGRFESLENDMRVVAKRIGVDLPPLAHINRAGGDKDRTATARYFRHLVRRMLRPAVTRKKSAAGYFDAVTDAFVREFYAEDIERFGYHGGVDTTGSTPTGAM